MSVLKISGLRSVYNGFCATLYRDVIFNMAFFSSREMFVDLYERHYLQSPNAWTRVILGYPAGCIACTISCPLDVVKKRIQGSDLNKISSMCTPQRV